MSGGSYGELLYAGSPRMIARNSTMRRFIAIVLFTLLSSVPAFALRLASMEPECGMSCCKRKKNPQCCKRHLHSSAKKHGPLLKPASSCASGCAAVPAKTASPLGLVELAAREASGTANEHPLSNPDTATHASSYDARLHQRPPPFLT